MPSPIYLVINTRISLPDLEFKDYSQNRNGHNTGNPGNIQGVNNTIAGFSYYIKKYILTVKLEELPAYIINLELVSHNVVLR